MKLKTTIALVAATVALFGYIRFYESKQLSTREAAVRAQHVIDVDRDRIDGITITNDEGIIELRKRQNRWQIESPVKDRADATMLNQLFTAAETLKKEGSIDETNKTAHNSLLKSAGVAKSNVRLKFHGPQAPPELLFGKETAVEGKVYARLEGSNVIYAVGSTLKAQVQKKADDFRDRRLVDVNANEIEKVVIRTPAGEIEVQKLQDEWQLNKPVKARGDATGIRDLLARTVNTTIEAFLPNDHPSLANAGLNEPRATVQLFTRSNATPLDLQIGQTADAESGKVFARLSTRDGTYLLPKRIEELLTLKPNDLRDRHLLRLNFDTVDRMTITGTGRAKVVLARQEESWLLKAPAEHPADSPRVRKLVEALQNQPVAAFVTDVASDLKKYGLDHPQLTVSFSSYASENTAETTAGEHAICEVLFGKVEGENVYARLEEEPFIVSVPKTILDLFPADPNQWHDLSIFKLSPSEIVAVEVTKEEEPAVAVVRDEKRGWKSVTKPEAKVEIANITSLCNTLATLRAVRWAQARESSDSEKPPLIVSFKTAGGASHKLVVGEPTPDGMWPARTDGIAAPFVLSNPDFGAFLLPLLAEGAATSSPAPVTR